MRRGRRERARMGELSDRDDYEVRHGWHACAFPHIHSRAPCARVRSTRPSRCPQWIRVPAPQQLAGDAETPGWRWAAGGWKFSQPGCETSWSRKSRRSKMLPPLRSSLHPVFPISPQACVRPLPQYTTSEDDAEYSWIGWFCSRKGHEFLCEVDREFVEDNFNLYGLRALVR